MVTFQGRQFDSWEAARASVSQPQTAAVVEPPSVAVLEPPAPAPVPVMAPARRHSLTEKHRPRALSELAGQERVVAVLADYVKEPYSAAWLFAGETGTGKTSAAYALAAELGCDLDASPQEFGGIYTIPSGDLSAKTLETVWPGLWNIPFLSTTGWKVLIVNEVEALKDSVERLWLDKLEDLPPKCAVIFTTNAAESLSARFVDRCCGGVLEFLSSADDLMIAAGELARAIWQKETGGPMPAELCEKLVQRSIRCGNVSFRRVVQNMVPLLAQKGGEK